MKTRKEESQPNALAALVLPAKYLQGREHVFPNQNSLGWYMRKHRARLYESGAVLEIAGRQQINPPKFDELVLETGAVPRKTDREEAAA